MRVTRGGTLAHTWDLTMEIIEHEQTLIFEPDDGDPLAWTIEATAKKLSISDRTVKRLIEIGELEGVRLCRCRRVLAYSVYNLLSRNRSAANRSTSSKRIASRQYFNMETNECQKESEKMGFTSEGTRRTSGHRSPMQAARELDDLLARRTRKKPKQS